MAAAREAGMSVLDDVLREKPWRQRRHKQPRSIGLHPSDFRRKAPKNPLADPLAHIKRPLRALNGPEPGKSYVEFEIPDVLELRKKYHASQVQFARMMGISVGTLRNWEQGRRRPHGPARALIRILLANPNLVADTLLRFKRVWWLE
jgi:putative transcriptional regulator